MSADAVARLSAALEGRYRILGTLGEGGMAVVYLADDLRHERKVALKVLRPELAAVVGAERFLTEIKTTANLQHPHILPLYDSGEADSFLFYVMPHVEGETLRERLDREKQLPVDEAVRIAVAVAGALDYAHRHGVVHRDIKPGNILMQDEQPVVGDFGIAIAVGAAGGARLTETGLSLGTPYYMSPEQATGDMDVGPASDIYALGAVLYELLTGEPPYTGNTAQAVLGRIIQGMPVSATTLRRSVPAHVDAAIRKALEKLPADRFTGANELAKALQDPAFRHGEARALGAVAGGGALRWAAGVLALTTVAFGWAWWRAAGTPEPARAVERFAMPFLPGDEPEFLGSQGFALSPDGTMLVYRHRVDGQPALVVRRWDELAATPIRESVGGFAPTVSPDGLEVAFRQGGDIKALAFAGGPVRTLGPGIIPRWESDGFVYVTTNQGVLVRIPAAGGAVDTLSTPPDGHGHLLFDLLPGGRRALVTDLDFRGGPPSIFGLDLETGERTDIGPGARAQYLATGHLVFEDVDGETMMAAPFDPRSMELLAAPVAVLVGMEGWSVADDGKLFYGVGGRSSPANLHQMIWVDREGNATPVDPTWTFEMPASDNVWSLSPDGTRMALRELSAEGPDLWIKRLDTGPRSRLTDDAADERWPIWRPGTDEVTFISSRGGGLDIWTRRADAITPAELVFDSEKVIATIAWSPDGEWLLMRTTGPRGQEGRRDILAIRPGVDSVPLPLLAEPAYDEMYPEVSPDGRYIVYQTTETERHEVYVRPFPDVGAGKWQVSVNGGRLPRWSPEGDEIFFQSPDAEMMVVPVRTGTTFQAGTPEMLFASADDWYRADITGTIYVVAPDASRFMMVRNLPVTPADEAGPPVRAVLVNNFAEEIRARVPVR